MTEQKEKEYFRMDAYYYSFTKTNILIIDKILSAVASAGKAFHNTEDWNEKLINWCGQVGNNPVEWIQNMANNAAKEILEIQSTNTALLGACEEVVKLLNRVDIIRPVLNAHEQQILETLQSAINKAKGE